jgi:hypothetical protein
VIGRRALFGGLIALAAPAIIRTPGLLMPVKPPPLSVDKIWRAPDENELLRAWKTLDELAKRHAIQPIVIDGRPYYFVPNQHA